MDVRHHDHLAVRFEGTTLGQPHHASGVVDAHERARPLDLHHIGVDRQPGPGDRPRTPRTRRADTARRRRSRAPGPAGPARAHPRGDRRGQAVDPRRAAVPRHRPVPPLRRTATRREAPGRRRPCSWAVQEATRGSGPSRSTTTANSCCGHALDIGARRRRRPRCRVRPRRGPGIPARTRSWKPASRRSRRSARLEIEATPRHATERRRGEP